MTQQISEAWYVALDRFAEKYGTPLPKKLLQLGSADTGWGALLNVTKDEINGIPPYSVMATWGGMPAGVLGANGGTMVMGSDVNEDEFINWLDSDVAK